MKFLNDKAPIRAWVAINYNDNAMPQKNILNKRISHSLPACRIDVTLAIIHDH